MRKVLIIEDTSFVSNICKTAIESNGEGEVSTALTGNGGIDKAIDLEPDIIVLDYMLPDINGDEVYDILKEEGLASKVIFATGHNDDKVLKKINNMKDVDLLRKPFQPEELLELIRA